jgi:ferritin
MMISQALQEAINQQITHELYSAHLYLSMSAYFACNTFPGMAKWMRVQAAEETTHALKFFDYVNDRSGRVVMGAIGQPPTEFESPLDVFQKALEHERKVTGLINNLYALALKENDYATQVMLQWFVNEQVEEEKNATEIVEQLRRLGPSTGGLIHYDRQLGKRGEGKS